ncbi:MAG TPA: TolC family protein, partial [Chthonomonadales bacterium]|nr:TolC family protein [Chthonomonadales bacterium]
LSWEPFDFGYRRARVQSAQKTELRTAAQVTLTQLGVATAVAEASLALLADEQRVQAMAADVNRREVFARSVHALVDAHLRPGADASRADAEVATARTRLIQAQEEDEVGGIALAQLLGLAGSRVQMEPGPLLQAAPESDAAEAQVENHPAAQVQRGRVDEEKAKIGALNREYVPHFTTEALLSARGSGEKSDGSTEPGLNGLGFTAYNWEAGLTVQMDLTSIFAIHARKRVETFNQRREEALYAQTLQTLTAQQQTARAQLDGARRMAQNTPIELASSRQSESQATARFRAGLGTMVDVAEAQSLLARAEMDDSLARLRVWRALADMAAANGDLTSFLDAAKSTTTGGH